MDDENKVLILSGRILKDKEVPDFMTFLLVIINSRFQGDVLWMKQYISEVLQVKK